jgi:hypothetical protein
MLIHNVIIMFAPPAKECRQVSVLLIFFMHHRHSA